MDTETTTTAKAPIARGLLDGTKKSPKIKISPGSSLIAGGVAGAIEATVTVRPEEAQDDGSIELTR